jgi:hypothetical protein
MFLLLEMSVSAVELIESIEQSGHDWVSLLFIDAFLRRCSLNFHNNLHKCFRHLAILCINCSPSTYCIFVGIWQDISTLQQTFLTFSYNFCLLIYVKTVVIYDVYTVSRNNFCLEDLFLLISFKLSKGY